MNSCRKVMRLRQLLLLLVALLSAGFIFQAAARGARKKQVTATDRVARIAKELELLRGRKFKHPVKVEIQTTEQFRSYVASELDKQLPEAMAAGQSRALQALGILPPGYNLREGITELFISQAGAYYDPETRKFYILMAGLPDAQMDAIILHELGHALQDQYHDLKTLRETILKNPNEDIRSAISYVFEGEASYLMTLYQLKQAGQTLSGLPPEARETVFAAMKDLDRDRLTTISLATAPAGPEGEEIRKAMGALKDIPGILFWSLYDPYFKGQYAIDRVFVQRGWRGVDELYAFPPTSTEQFIHPEKLERPRDEPTELMLPPLEAKLGSEWTRVYSNSLGEAGVVSFFDKFAPKVKLAAGAGWDGDRYALYSTQKDENLICWWSVWDNEKEAEQFRQALALVPVESFPLRGERGMRSLRRNGERVSMCVGPKAAVDMGMEY